MTSSTCKNDNQTQSKTWSKVFRTSNSKILLPDKVICISKVVSSPLSAPRYITEVPLAISYKMR
jgi:hypothetical protein